MGIREAIPLFLTLILASPAALATWSAHGTQEPDTTHDIEGGWMHLDPDTTLDLEHRQVYFNGWQGQAASAAATSFTGNTNPNVAALDTAIMPHHSQPFAILGFWKDCNEDGYIGFGEAGLVEYSAMLPYNKDLCPPDNSNPRKVGYFPSHSDNQWVREFISIGYDDVRTTLNENPFNVNDTGARVWADWNLPTSATEAYCPTNPQPYGTYRSTGGFLRWSDCYTGYQITGTFNTLAHELGQDGLAFDDAPKDRPDQSGSDLNVRNPWGEEGDATMVSAFDCNGTPIQVQDTTGQGGEITVPVGNDELTLEYAEDGYIVDARAPNVGSPGVNPAGTPAGTVNQTEEYTFPGVYGDCDPSDENSSAETPYTLEGANEPVSAGGRTRTDFYFYYQEGIRAPSTTTFALGQSAPDRDYGTRNGHLFPYESIWVSNQLVVTTNRNPYVNRETLQVEDVTFMTFYAYVSPGIVEAYSLDMPKPDVYAEYGAEACRLDPSPFVCDATQWWRNAAGEDIVPRDGALGDGEDGQALPYGVYVGQPYNLRDIDCWDASAGPLRSAGIHQGVVTDTACGHPRA